MARKFRRYIINNIKEKKMTIPTGDTERQAILRDKLIKETENEANIYIGKILSVLKPKSKIIDIGCGTAHIIEKLARKYRNTLFIGLDISEEMISSAKNNTKELTNIELIQGNGLELAFISSELDIVINRLADYSPGEVYRILKEGGYFFVYGLGPDADREIVEFFLTDTKRKISFCLKIQLIGRMK